MRLFVDRYMINLCVCLSLSACACSSCAVSCFYGCLCVTVSRVSVGLCGRVSVYMTCVCAARLSAGACPLVSMGVYVCLSSFGVSVFVRVGRVCRCVSLSACACLCFPLHVFLLR